MKRVAPSKNAFSLVEVVIAIAVVMLGIIAIMSLFGVSFSAVRDVSNQGEAYGVAQALPAYLQSAGFTNVYASVEAGTATNIYAYATGTNTLVLDTNGASDMSAAAIAQRSGRLFNITLTVSTNAPVVVSTNSSTTPAYAPTLPGSGLPDSGTGYGDAFLPVNVKIYAVGQVPAPSTTAQSFPVLNYDTVLSR